MFVWLSHSAAAGNSAVSCQHQCMKSEKSLENSQNYDFVQAIELVPSQLKIDVTVIRSSKGL